MFNQFKNLKFWIKFDRGRSLIGLLIGLIVFLLINSVSDILWIKIIISIIISIISMIIIQHNSINKYADDYEEFNKKDRYITPEDLRGFSENVDKILDLDKEINDFLEKYSSGKKPDYYEKELNKQWKIHGDKFVKRADKILKSMSNVELMYTLLGTERIKDITEIFEYFKPYKIDVDYLKNHPDKAKEYYYENLMQQDAIQKTAINEYYYKIIMDKNYFEEIERFVLSKMSNAELMELAAASKDWYEKLYYYGFIKPDDKKKEEIQK